MEEYVRAFIALALICGRLGEIKRSIDMQV
jgi:hypothetical protein